MEMIYSVKKILMLYTITVCIIKSKLTHCTHYHKQIVFISEIPVYTHVSYHVISVRVYVYV